MMNFRKIAAPSKGASSLLYFTEDKSEPIHQLALDEAGRQLEEGGRLVAYYPGRDSRVSRRHRRGLVAAQAQAQRLRLGVLVAQVGQSRQRVRRNAGRERGDLERLRSRQRQGDAARRPGAGAQGHLGKIKTGERNIRRERPAGLGWQHRTAMEGLVHERLSDGERFDRAYEFAARHLAEEFHTAALIEHKKLGMYAARGLIGTGIAGRPVDITRVVKWFEERGIRLKGEHVALVVGLFDEKVRVTNTAQNRIE